MVRDAADDSSNGPAWTQHHFDLVPPIDHPKFSWPAVFLGLCLVLGPAYWIGNQAIVQRKFGTRSENDARSAYVLCAAIKMFFPLLLVIPGLIALALYREQFGIPFGDGGLADVDKSWDGNVVLPIWSSDSSQRACSVLSSARSWLVS